jgi:hypothetical protein
MALFGPSRLPIDTASCHRSGFVEIRPALHLVLACANTPTEDEGNLRRPCKEVDRRLR